MGVETPVQPDQTVQTSGTNYKAAINNGISAIKQSADQFAPHEQTVPDMTVRLEAGRLFDLANATLTEKVAQNTLTLTAPTTNPRKDIVHVDRLTGDVGVAQGAEAASPTDPAIPADKIPIARITLQTTTTEIANSILDDLRTMQDSTLGVPSGTRMLFQQSSAPVGWTKVTELGGSPSGSPDESIDNMALRVTTGLVTNGGVAGFTSVFGASKVVGSASPGFSSHSHADPIHGTSGGSVGIRVSPVNDATFRQTGATGSGSSHDHTLSLDIRYIDVIIASKD